MATRWLIIYATFPSEAGPSTTRASIIFDREEDGTANMPYGVTPEQVADDCFAIHAIIEIAADTPPLVVIGDQPFSLDPDDPAVVEEDVPPARGSKP